VLAFLNIVGAGMEDQANEQNLDDMDPATTAAAATEQADLIVGVKTAHYRQPGWGAPDRALAAAERAGLPVMADVEELPGHPYADLLARLRPGDIATHMYGAHLPTVGADGRVRDYIWAARERGVRFDVGHGAGSFAYRVAVPCLEQGFGPDAISTDLHRMNINGPVFSMLTTVSKFLNLGLPLGEVIALATTRPAHLIGRPELGRLTEGGEADLALFALRRGEVGFWDSGRGRMTGDRRLECRLTLRAGAVVYDPDGLTLPDWRRQ
jgi:dihydroorotase